MTQCIHIVSTSAVRNELSHVIFCPIFLFCRSFFPLGLFVACFLLVPTPSLKRKAMIRVGLSAYVLSTTPKIAKSASRSGCLRHLRSSPSIILTQTTKEQWTSKKRRVKEQTCGTLDAVALATERNHRQGATKSEGWLGIDPAKTRQENNVGKATKGSRHITNAKDEITGNISDHTLTLVVQQGAYLTIYSQGGRGLDSVKKSLRAISSSVMI